MTRRELLLAACAGSLYGQAPERFEPQNLSYALESIPSQLTPQDRFFVRDHFHEPELSLSAWRLRIEGRVKHPLELSMADLLESPAKKLESVLECAGNAAGGSAASDAIWEGTPLAYLLREAGAAEDAADVALAGADSGRLMADSPQLPYCQIVPIAKCRRPESLIAFKLNDSFLPRRNGFPARALLPGWYAMDSVKWLQRIVVLGPGEVSPEFESSGMRKVYNRVVDSSGEPRITRLAEVLVKSAIAWPTDKSRLPAGQHMVRGFAWTGAGLIRGVEFSGDGGKTWLPAKLESAPKTFAWVRWNCAWPAESGDHTLLSRATDSSGHRQPLIRDSGRRDGYELNFCAPVRCSVR